MKTNENHQKQAVKFQTLAWLLYACRSPADDSLQAHYISILFRHSDPVLPRGHLIPAHVRAAPSRPHTCQIDPKILPRFQPAVRLYHPHHHQAHHSSWVKFTDLLPVPARSSLRLLRLRSRRRPRPPRVVLSSASSTPDALSTLPSLVARER